MEDQDDQLSVAGIIETLSLLLGPSICGQTCGDSDRDPFMKQLKQRLETLDRTLCDTQPLSLASALKERIALTGVPDTSVTWQYVNHILQLLYLLTQTLQKQETSSVTETAEVGRTKPKRPQDAPPLTKALLSLSQLSTVKHALQLVASLGVCPNLAPGVGIPLQHRSKLITVAPVDAATVADMTKASQSNKARLSVCVSVLAEMLNIEQLQSVILSAHLNDVLAALLQLLYGFPVTGIGNKDREKDTSQCVESKQSTPKVGEEGDRTIPCQQASGAQLDAVSSVDGQCSGERTSDKGEGATSARAETRAADCREVLGHVMASVSPPSLIRELMVLQAGVPKQVQTARSPRCTVVTPPGWLRKGCSQMMIRLANAPQGMQHLYDAISAGSDPGSPVAWKHCGTVAKIIAGYPVQAKFLHQYVANISKQLMDLLHTGGDEGKKLTQLLGTVACAMTAKHKDTFFLHFHKPLLQPLLNCLQSPEKKLDRTVILSEEALTECLENLHKVYVLGQQPLSDMVCTLQPVIAVLWGLYCVTHSAVYSIKQHVRSLVMGYLRSLPCPEAAGCLHQLCLGQGAQAVTFTPGSQGGLQAVWGNASRDTGVGDSHKVDAVINVLQDLKKNDVTAELLVALLKEMTEMISKESQTSDIMLPPEVLGSEVRHEKQGELMRRVTVLHLLASICETFGSECLTDNTHILLFVKASLEQGVAVCRGTSDQEMAMFETETMSMAMGLLTAVMAGALKMQDEDRVLMDSMLPLLEVIGQGHTDQFIREMASDIRIAIATRGAVWSSLQRTDKGQAENKPQKNAGQQHTNVGVVSGSGKSDSSLLFMEAPDRDDAERLIGTQPGAKPLIEVLSDHPAPSPEAAGKKEEQSLSSHVPVVEEIATGDRRSSSQVSLKNSVPSPAQRQSESPATELTAVPNVACSGVCEVSPSRTDREDASVTLKSATKQDSKSNASISLKSKQEDSISNAGLLDSVQHDSKSETDFALKSKQEDTAPKPSVCAEREGAGSVGHESEGSVGHKGEGSIEHESEGSVGCETEGSVGCETEGSVGRESKGSALQTVFEELCDPLLPVRGHALMILARLVQERDPETLGHRGVVLKVFEENLQHGDSYLYLPAIAGLTALADPFPEAVLTSLTSAFTGHSGTQAALTAEHRLKVGEALMKATRNLGEMTPKYRDLLLGAVLTGARDKDTTVRASSVSNLAEVCALLRFSLGPVLQEVLSCCSALLDSDEAIVRRAAALTLAKLLEGLGSDCFSVLESSLSRLYRVLKKACARDQDDGVRLHANLALDHLDSLTRAFAFPRQTLQKKIQVLPDSDTFR